MIKYQPSSSSPDQALWHGLRELRKYGEVHPSRSGDRLVYPGTVITWYCHDVSRVSLHPARDANPFFDFMEIVHTIAGASDNQFMGKFEERFDDEVESDLPEFLCYGHRWISHFGMRQIKEACRDFVSKSAYRPASHPGSIDFLNDALNVSCDLSLTFQKDAKKNRLDLVTFSRSSEIVGGAHGANLVHMSALHELVSMYAGLERGIYQQIVANYYVATNTMKKIPDKMFEITASMESPPDSIALFDKGAADVFEECADFVRICENCEYGPDVFPIYTQPLLSKIAVPMMKAWRLFNESRHAWGCFNEDGHREAIHWAGAIGDVAWSMACRSWLWRHKKAVERYPL
jgi:hypothetical protein